MAKPERSLSKRRQPGFNFYASTIVETAQGESDATIQVFDTEDNLLTTIGNLLTDVRVGNGALQYKLVASELGAVGGIAKITLSDKVDVNPAFSRTRLADFGFTPVGAPGTGTEGPPPAECTLYHHPVGEPGSAVRRIGELVRFRQR